MAKKQSGGVSIKGTKVNIGGDVVGRDKITTHYGASDEFKKIRELIDKRPVDSNVDKAELKETVDKIENEVKKGEEANPAVGAAKAVQLIVKKAKE